MPRRLSDFATEADDEAPRPRAPEDLTNLVADWAVRTPVHGCRLRETARRNPLLLHRVVYNLLRCGGGPDSNIYQLRNALTHHDLDHVDWQVVAARLTTRRH